MIAMQNISCFNKNMYEYLKMRAYPSSVSPGFFATSPIK